MDLHTALIVVHAVAASFVILVGPVNILRRRKDAAHRLLGRTFALMLYLVCVSGMFIYSAGFSVFHALAIFTFITTTLGILAIRRGNVIAHRANMIGSWAGTVTAGVFAATIPGRAIPALAVDEPALFWAIVASIIVAAMAWIAIVLSPASRRRLDRARRQRGGGAAVEGGASPRSIAARTDIAA
ncbi:MULTISPECIES: DUF2306 domain-containing protein [Microbacterium]|uniref:DUF2306 domain-containing protein n=1 Tax=Microbacterium TaxID=33882 RepID=UPI00217F1769|nr:MULTISPECIES: DUF2306 domain-containing protein [Microbacterium]UWF77664.1 DUF2306 domain-containing protein [Microbacterium neungamense]WCM55833.1 DUF2306 domain-containing protein [Microbacterium sp. EF45047]